MTTVVRPIRFTADVAAMREFLVTVGLAPRVEANRGGWVDLVAGTGLVALHDAASSDIGARPGDTTLSFETDDLAGTAGALRAAGFGEAAVWDEAYGRTLSITDPAGAEVWIDERSDDDYGYRRHRAAPASGLLHVMPLRPAARRYPEFLGVLGLTPRGGERRQVMAGPGGRIALHPPAAGTVAGDHATVDLAFETSEPLAALVDRMRAAGYDARLRHEESGAVAVVTDPDGQTVTVHPAPFTVRAAAPDDAAGIVALGERVLPATYGPIAGDGYVRHILGWWSPENIARSLGRTVTFVAEAGGRTVGVANLGTAGQGTAADGEPVMWKLYVDPEWQYSGVGSALLGAIVRAVPAGSPRLLLEHLAGNDRAAAFYARRGFRPLRVSSDPDGWPDQVWLQLPLD